MTGPNQTVEVLLKIVVDKDGTRAVNVLTGEVVAAAKAEDALAEAAKRRAAAYRQTVPGRVGAALEQNRQGVWERFQQRQAANDLAAMGRNADGSRMSAMDRLQFRGNAAAGRLGLSGREVAGGAAAAFAVSMRTADGYGQFGRIEGDAFMTERQKLEAKARANPFAGWAYSRFKDAQEAYTGEREKIERAKRAGAEGEAREGAFAQFRLTQQQSEFERQTQADRAAGYAGFQTARRDPGIDRTTAGGRLRYEEESRLLPVRRQLAVATKEQALAEQQYGRAQKQNADNQAEVKKIEGELLATRVARQKADRDTSGTDRSGAKGESERLARQEGVLAARLQGAIRRAEQSAETERGAGGQSVMARRRVSELQLDAARVETGIAREREDQAAAGAQSLSQLGLGGRELAKQGLDLINQGMPLDQIPEDLLAAARAAAPETVKKAEEAYGEQFKGEFRGRAPGEAGLQSSADARRRTDTAEQNEANQEEKYRKEFESGLSAVFDKVTPMILAILERNVEQAVKRIELEQFQKVNGQ